MPDEKYEHNFHANAGGQYATLNIHDDSTVEGEFHASSMGNRGYHYRFSGKQEVISDGYGWIRLHQIVDLGHDSMIPIQALGTELIYEYVKLHRSRFVPHPEDMIWVSGHSNEVFDLILFTSPFVLESLDGLQQAHADGILEETEPEEMLVYINDAFIEHLTNLFVDCDKMKFTKR